MCAFIFFLKKFFLTAVYQFGALGFPSIFEHSYTYFSGFLGMSLDREVRGREKPPNSNTHTL